MKKEEKARDAKKKKRLEKGRVIKKTSPSEGPTKVVLGHNGAIVDASMVDDDGNVRL